MNTKQTAAIASLFELITFCIIITALSLGITWIIAKIVEKNKDSSETQPKESSLATKDTPLPTQPKNAIPQIQSAETPLTESVFLYQKEKTLESLISEYERKNKELNDTIKQKTAYLQNSISEYESKKYILYEEYVRFKSRRLEFEEKLYKYNDLIAKEKYINKTFYDLEQISQSKENAFSYMAKIMADYKLIQYQYSIDYLENKKRPALVEAQRIRELKAQTQTYLEELIKLKYLLNDLYDLFPELDDYIDNEPAPTTLHNDNSLTRLPDSIWETMNDSQKNQVVLDNYIKRHKSKWELGRDYELYVGYKYQILGYDVDYYGCNHGINDLGRDLIVSKDGEIGIVQCKYWSAKKQIHEKHIAQLYGTVVSYIIEHNYLPELVHGIFITNIKLSSTAKKFADYLGIKYKEIYDIGEFPRIKCNINRNEYNIPTKIYHLPTDQQYDSVKINEPGECFVFTVEEAERLGFRRAYKWHSN